MNNSSNTPLVIDLDGTLVLTDTLHESAIKAIRHNPSLVFSMLLWLGRGKAFFKQKLTQRTQLDPVCLPYNTGLLNWLSEEKAKGRRLILSTAADSELASSIAGHLQLFDEVHASDGVDNNAGDTKARQLIDRFGQGGFDYAGNSRADIKVWKHCRTAIVTNASPAVQKLALALPDISIDSTFASPTGSWKDLLRMFRFHQWLKNSLLFIPFLASHQIFSIENWLTMLLAFLAFGTCASSVYIVNDLLDLDSDRLHPRKKRRPFASGSVPVANGALVAPLLLLASFLLAWQVNSAFLLCLAVYLVLTTLYSFLLKRIVLLDCLILSLLYTIRIIAGTMALGMALSFWLLAFSIFLFQSLAFVKRYAEFLVQKPGGDEKVHGRGYHTSDAPVIAMFGIGTGLMSTLVLALYLNSESVVLLYETPQLMWGCIPVMLFWISWIWLQTYRDNMHDDPVIFAVKDKTSLLCGAIFALFMVASATGLP